jgi:hypothetical protein
MPVFSMIFHRFRPEIMDTNSQPNTCLIGAKFEKLSSPKETSAPQIHMNGRATTGKFGRKN